jgi:hypothetical protein
LPQILVQGDCIGCRSSFTGPAGCAAAGAGAAGFGVVWERAAPLAIPSPQAKVAALKRLRTKVIKGPFDPTACNQSRRG